MSDDVPSPGWYPDDKRRSVERFSDGSTWTGETRTRPWWRLAFPGLQTRRTRILLSVAVALLLAAVVGAVLSEPAQSEVSAADLAAGEGPSLPPDQRGFLAIVADGQAESEGASDVKVVNERRIRGEALCDFLPGSLRVRDWRGVVGRLQTTATGDDAELSVLVAEGVEVVSAEESVDPDTELYDALAGLDEGDHVVFSGRFVPGDHCVGETSTFDSSQMQTPDFAFRFGAVGPAPGDS